ncbi:MAG TPA: hypothetical protein VFY39_06555 [Gammaproteobacteria bacterium]|nr:hypothetical protein [Gammaproteobacteria bacterium]
MSTENVTPIRGGGPPDSPSRPKPPAGAKKCHRFHLQQPDDGPDNLRLIQALHGVCYAIEQLGDENGSSISIELGTAAEILSLMLQERIESN